MPVRIYELAREFDLPTKEVLAACREAGLDVKSHSSTVEEDEADRIRARLAPESAEVADQAVAPPAAPEAPPEPVLSPEEQLARARGMRVALPTRHARRPEAEGVKLTQPPRPPACPEAPVEAPAEEAIVEAVEAPAPEAEAAPAEPVAESRRAGTPAETVETPAETVETPAEPAERAHPIRRPPRARPKAGPKLAPRPKLAPKPSPRAPAPGAAAPPEPHPQAVGLGAPGPPAKPGELPARPGKPKRRPAAAAEPGVEKEVEEKEAEAPRRGRRRGARKETEEEEAASRQRAQAFRRHERQRQREDQEVLDQALGGGGGESGIASERVRLLPGGRPAATRARRGAATSRRAGTAEGPHAVEVDLPITVRSLSSALGMKVSDIIRRLMDQGVMATVNDALEEETAREMALGLEMELAVRRERRPEDIIAEIEAREDGAEALAPRAPIVTFLGHVDHGKTSLMDTIRKTHVVDGEAGGITQHIGAYRVPVGERWVTFLDTPGHEAFTAMRARGAQVTDIVVLVIAADDGVMPQTEEAINHAKAAGVPMVVAINKCDLPQANPQRVKEQLTQFEMVVEEWGGKTICINTSATTGENIDALLESLLLEAEMLELKADPQRPALGTVIEAERSEGLGAEATLLVQNGTLHAGDIVLAGTTYGRVRALRDETGRRLQEAGPTVPVRVAGLSDVPDAGERFYVLEDLALAKQIAQEREGSLREEALVSARRPRTLEAVFERMTTEEAEELPLILKADVQGSVEAIRENLERIEHPEVRVRVLHAGVGGVTTSDVLLAEASRAIIIGFNAVADAEVRALAEDRGVDIRHYNIIYRITEDVRKALEGLLEPETQERRLGEAEVLQTFKVSRSGTVAGCRVTEGVISRNARVRIARDGLVVHEGPIDSLRRVKDDVREVRAGQECGLHLAGYNDVKVGDRLEAFEKVTVQRTLGSA